MWNLTGIALICICFTTSISAKIIDGGNQHTLLLANDGSVWAMGKNEYGELGDGTFERKIFPVKVK